MNKQGIFGKRWDTQKWGIGLLLLTIPSLFCCTVPVFLVSIGVGAAAISVYGAHFQFLHWFEQYAGIILAISLLLIIAAGWVLYRPGRTSPADQKLAHACNIARWWNIRFFWGSVLIWIIAMFGPSLIPSGFIPAG